MPTVLVDEALVATIRRELRRLADPTRAPQMQAYMKSAMPYLGVRVPQVRRVVRAAAKARPPAATEALRDTALALWRPAAFREERYASTALLAIPAARALRRSDLIDTYRELIVTGAWWDHVDEVSHRVGELLLDCPAEIDGVLRGWAVCDDRWLRRTSIICQLGARERTDAGLLTTAILASAGEPDFFLRKGIGWVLRDYARTDPEWVREFVETHELSPLSRREALKRI